jgi:hypothetical protein
MPALQMGILNINLSHFPLHKYNTNKFMVEIYFFVTTIINMSPFPDWLLRATVPIDAVSMWPATVTTVPTSVNDRDALSFDSITQMSQMRGK